MFSTKIYRIALDEDIVSLSNRVNKFYLLYTSQLDVVRGQRWVCSGQIEWVRYDGGL